jgi:hypothetical protein
MNPPLILIAHYDPMELVWCPDCQRISNSATQCHGCGANAGLVGLNELMNPKQQDVPKEKIA